MKVKSRHTPLVNPPSDYVQEDFDTTVPSLK